MQSLNHAVLLVGYGFDEQLNLPFWTIKNSYGSDWGEEGYIRLQKGNDTCGVSRAPRCSILA